MCGDVGRESAKIQTSVERGQRNVSIDSIAKVIPDGEPAPSVAAIIGVSDTQRRLQMPKGQQRSNKEAKKPKQPKKLTTPVSGSVVPPARSIQAPGKHKGQG
jgi:hypothetical protein